MILILLSQLITIAALLTIYSYRITLFNTVFNLVSTAVILAFIPNFITSLLLSREIINGIESQIGFGITGAIATIFLWYVLKDIPCK